MNVGNIEFEMDGYNLIWENANPSQSKKLTELFGRLFYECKCQMIPKNLNRKMKKAQRRINHKAIERWIKNQAQKCKIKGATINGIREWLD